MGSEILPDRLWRVIQPLLPPPKPKKTKRGRPRIDDRKALTGILFVLKTGLPWEMLPKDLGWGCGMTCWSRLRDWQDAGVWEKLHRVMLERLSDADRIDWSRASLDSGCVPAPRGALKPGRIRRIAANRARNAMLSSTFRESLSA